MSVPLDARFFWDDSAGSFPSLFSSDSDYEGTYLQGDDSGFTGGTTTVSTEHDHIADQHTHSNSSHNHQFAGNQRTGTSTMREGFGSKTRASATHSHGFANGRLTTIVVNNTVVNINAVTAFPPTVRMVLLKPDETNLGIPVGGICFTDEATLPTQFVKTDGNNGTNDWDEKFIFLTSGLSVGTFGSTTHNHPLDNHTHILDPHGHAAQRPANASPNFADVSDDASADTIASLNHHNVTMNNQSQTASTAVIGSTSVSNEPAFIKLVGIQNKGASPITPVGVILVWTASVGSIPTELGWFLCDGNNGTPNCIDKQIKITTGASSGTGGDNLCTHTGDSHNHSHTGSHTHSETEADVGTLKRKSGSEVSALRAGSTHTHTWATLSVTPAAFGNNTFTMSSDDKRFTYRTVVFIKKISETQPGVFFGANF